MPEPEKEGELFCPQCKTWYPRTRFECLPLDLRCNKCIPAEVAEVLYDQKTKKAGQTLAAILDGCEAGKGLKPLERMVSQAYDAWGGSAAFCHDVVVWIKEMAATGKKGAAVSNAMKLLTLHAKVDRMKLEDDWKQMDDDTLRATLKIKLMALMAETQLESAKKSALNGLIGGQE